MIRKAIILAGGLGTRFLPATKAQPKEMIPVIDKPAIQYVVEEAVRSGITDILIITGKNKGSIEDHFCRSEELGRFKSVKQIEQLLESVNIFYARQKKPKGSGDAVLCGKSFINNEAFTVLLGDDIFSCKTPCLKQLIRVHEKHGSPVIAVERVDKKHAEKYGIVETKPFRDRTHTITRMMEKPKPGQTKSNLAVVGRYVLPPQIFELLEKTRRGKNNEVQLTDALQQLLQTTSMYAYEFEGKRYDVGNKLGYLIASVELALKRQELGTEFRAWLKKLSV